MKIILSHPTGNRNVRAVMQGMADAGLLDKFYTTIVTHPTDKWIKLFPKQVQSELLRRTYPIKQNLLKAHPFLEVSRMILSRIGLSNFTNHENAIAGVYAVYRNLDNYVASQLGKAHNNTKVKAVYAYEDGALATFKKAKQLGLKCIYDLPIAYWETSRRLMQEEADRLPQWAETLGGGILDSEKKLERKTLELEMADLVVTPGSFVKDSLPIWACDKEVIVSPFGSPASNDKNLLHGNENYNSGRPLRVLFAGSMSQRKGLGDLFAAIKIINSKNIELVIMGAPMVPMQFYKNEGDFTFETGRPNSEVLALMKTCDVFCLPSIVEGRALVMQEAMSQGLPIVITANTGGADLVIEGKTGFLVPIRSPESIAEKLSWFLQNRKEIQGMSIQAKQHALNYNWQAYASKIIDNITSSN